MADLSDVNNTLASLATTAIYPNGASQTSVAGVTVTTATGWPVPTQLDAIMAAGNAMVTVYPMKDTETNTTRFMPQMEIATTIPAAQLSLSVSGNQVTIGGSIKAGEVATLFVNYHAFSHSVIATDTAITIAQALSAQILGSTVSDSVVTVNGAFDIEVAVSVPVAMQSEVARQSRSFMVTAWCPTPAIRDAIMQAVDSSFKRMKRIVLPDGTMARMIYRGTQETDFLVKQRIYRRDLRYEVEYVTIATETDNTITDFAVGVTPTAGSTININI
jgi:hypothetical protein